MRNPLSISAIVLLFVVAASPLVPAQVKGKKTSQYSKAEREVRVVMEQLREAQLRNDVATLNRIYADDYTLTEGDGTVFTKRQRIAAIGELRFESSKLDAVTVRIYGDAAVMTSRATVKFLTEPTGPFHVQVTIVFVKRQGRCQVVAGHESDVK